MVAKLLELDDAYGRGSLHDVLISVQASMPEDVKYRTAIDPKKDSVRAFFETYYAKNVFPGASPEDRARYHFKRAGELGEGKSPSPYVSLATALSLPKQDSEEFLYLMEKALAVNPEEDPENKLAILLAQKRARYYLDNMDKFFLTGSGDIDESDTEYDDTDYDEEGEEE